MKKLVMTLAAGLLMAPLMPTPALSQEMEQGELGMVMRVDVEPAHREAYVDALEMLKEAATAADVSDYEWHFWGHSTGFTLYYPIDEFAYFDDPQQLWRSFEGTEGQATRDEFFEAIQQVPAHSTTEIIESIPSLYYWPEGFDEVNAAHVHYEWLADGATEEQWVENAEKWVAFFEKIGYPYGARAYRTRIGEERMTWVFFVPSVADFHSDASWDDLVEAADAGDEMEALGAEWSEIVRRMEHESSGYVESMSYVPDAM